MLFSGAKVQLFRGKQNFSQLFHHLHTSLLAKILLFELKSKCFNGL